MGAGEYTVRLKMQRHGRNTEKKVREILRDAVRREGSLRAGLGSRVAARFRGNGLEKEIEELRGQEARPAVFRK